MTEIPPYPQSRPIEITDKAFLDQIFYGLQPEISEFTFANLYLFRHVHAYRLSVVRDGIVIFGKGYGGDEYFLPPLAGDIAGQLADLFREGLWVYGADERFRQQFLVEPSLLIQEDRDSFDYIYDRAELVQLPGNRFHKKKNRINYFMSRFTPTIQGFDACYLESSLRLLEEWARVRGNSEGGSAASEIVANREALHHASLLGLEGVVVTVGGDVKAFALGERLNHETSVCHFEKGDPFLEGVSQLVNREFNSRLYTDCRFVNREQDLGEPGLRGAKLSYHPLRMVKKFRAGKPK